MKKKILTEDSPKIVNKNGIEYELRCPKCKSSNIYFDAHAGSVGCKNCGFDTYGGSNLNDFYCPHD